MFFSILIKTHVINTRFFSPFQYQPSFQRKLFLFSPTIKALTAFMAALAPQPK